ncbi:hypothetical protein AURDEDRAFT_117314 [Auricularia subglabra TFB-10046 SS5]|nr:hypothetical protein AURDEDRAFT_117314 [Auricularia subglabra TFB-10046 SS5]
MPAVPPPPPADPTSTQGFVGLYEVDEAGVPYYRFPPWPQVPAGVTIVPFKDFKDVGIILRDDGEEELDGMGIPTIALSVVHGDGGAGSRSAKKRRRAQAEKNAREGIKLTWHEQWEEFDASTPVRPYDQRLTRGVRLEQAVTDFQSGRQWNSHLQSVFDFFRQFLGIVANPNQTKQKQAVDEGDFSDDEDMDAPTAMAHIIEDDRDPWADHALMNRFLDDPERAIKVFLSSFYSSKGLMWVPAKLKDGPILIGLFLQYLIKHRVLSESRKALERALAVAQLARDELPRTSDVGQSLSPEKFGDRCRELLGYADKGNLGAGVPWADEPAAADASSTPAAPVAPADDAAAIQAAIIDPDTMPAEPMQVDLNGHTVNVPAATASAAVGSGWDDDITAATSGWGDLDVGKYGAHAWAYAQGPNGEPALMPEPEDWTQSAVPETPLSEYLGPAVDPAALAQQRAENSVRRLVRVQPPNPGTTGPAAQLATLVLAPWRDQFSIDIYPPRMLFDHGKPGEYDPSADEINVFVRAEAVEKLTPGLALAAVWVQAVEKPKEGVKKKKKGKGASQGWWYIETFRATFVSYWTPDELESATKLT